VLSLVLSLALNIIGFSAYFLLFLLGDSPKWAWRLVEVFGLPADRFLKAVDGTGVAHALGIFSIPIIAVINFVAYFAAFYGLLRGVQWVRSRPGMTPGGTGR
jgi:hypothetical protein